MAELTVGIDIGTSSVKAVAADAEGNVVARSRIEHALKVPAPDQLEHDATEAWWDGPRRAVEALGADVRHDTLAAGISAMVPSMTAVDGAGMPVTPGLLYGDGRGYAGAESSSPTGNGEAQEFLRWSAGQAPKARGYWPAQAVAAVALGGEPVIDGGTALCTWPLYGPDGWDLARAAELGATPDQLPTVVPAGQVACRVGDLALASGSVDAFAEQIVCDAREPGDVVVMCGTTLMTWALIAEYRAVENLWTIPWHLPDRMCIGGPSNAGGLFLNWAGRLLAQPDETPLDPQRVPVWAPYPRGERVPLHDRSRRATLDRLDLTMGAAAVRRASFEAAGFMVADTLARADVRPNRLIASGGGTRVHEWIQTLADCTGVPVAVPVVAEGAALGMAFMARMALGLETSVVDAGRWARVDHIVDPDPRWTAACAERFAHFQALARTPPG